MPIPRNSASQFGFLPGAIWRGWMGALLLVGTAHADEPSDVDQELAEMALEAEGETIVVTGTRSESARAASPVTTEVIDRERLQEAGVQTAAEALALRPGLWLERSVAGTQGISIQGLGPQYTLILVDGMRQVGRTDGTLDLERFGVEDIEQIEVVRGPSSVLYGSDALGGVVNIISRTPRDGVAGDALARLDGRMGWETRGRIAGGMAGTSVALVGQLRHAEAILRSQIDDAADPESPATAFDAYDDAHLTGRALHVRDESLRVTASADYLRRDLRGVDAQGMGAIVNRRKLTETAASAVSAVYTTEQTALRLELGASVYRDQFLNDQRQSTALDVYTETTENLLEARTQVARDVANHRVLVGVEGLREELSSERLSRTGDRYRGAIFAQDEWRPGGTDSLLVVPAARVDADTQFGVNATPRLAARWQAEAGVVLRGSAGMGFRAPSFQEQLLLFANPGVGYLVEGNADLKPETSVSTQLGSEWRVTDWLQLGADAYVNQLRNMIFIVPGEPSPDGTLRFSYGNIGRARTLGGEASAMAVKGRAGIEVGYAYTYARDLDEDRALETIPRHRLTLTGRWRDRMAGVDAFAALVVTGRRPLYLGLNPDDPEMATLTPRRFDVRVRVAKRFTSGLGGFVGIDNALNTGDPVLDRTLPRTIYAGVELHR